MEKKGHSGMRDSSRGAFGNHQLTNSHHGSVKDVFEQSLSNLDISYIEFYLITHFMHKGKIPIHRFCDVVQMHWP
jgi:diketogulonate reductase-like aldo/keto reductase